MTIAAGCDPKPDLAGGSAPATNAGRMASDPATAVDVPQGDHLLSAHRAAADEFRAARAGWELPTDAGRIVAAVLGTAATGRTEGLRHLLTDDARWGLPDRRELLARPIFAGDEGQTFLAAFVRAASRFEGRANVECPPLIPAFHALVSSGAEPLWCVIRDQEGFDLLVFRLRSRSGQPWIDYVGFYEHRPLGPVRVPGGPPPPPILPPVREAIAVDVLSHQ